MESFTQTLLINIWHNNITIARVILFGKEVGGARSWYAIGNFSLQPSEFAKIGTLLGLSKFLSQINFDISQV